MTVYVMIRKKGISEEAIMPCCYDANETKRNRTNEHLVNKGKISGIQTNGLFARFSSSLHNCSCFLESLHFKDANELHFKDANEMTKIVMIYSLAPP